MDRRWRRALLVGVMALLGAGRARGDDDSVREAKAFYLDGKREFHQQHYQLAYELFERAYQTSLRPALLFDMAACLAALDRPRDAVAKLYDYLERVPDDPQRAAIQENISELNQRAVEQEAAVRAEREASGAALKASANDAQRAALEERIRALEEKLGAEAQPRRRARRGLAIGLGVTAGVVVAGVALTLGLVLNRGEPYTPSSFPGGPLQSTK
jgi:hypothetical protein